MKGSELFALARGGVSEVFVHGEIVVCEGDQVVYQSLPQAGKFPARSILKPFQLISGTLALDDKTQAERRASYMGSTAASEAQIRQMDEWRSKFPQLAQAVSTPESLPLDEMHRAKLLLAKAGKDRRFHTCFMKHFGILETCAKEGWNLPGYLSESHPFHQRLCATLKQHLGRVPSFVVDGCGLPTPVLELSEVARLFSRLIAGTDPRLQTARDLMMAYPEWIGGPGRMDTEMMKANPGQLVAKEGADGLFAIGFRPEKPVGMILKLYAGYKKAFAATALASTLERYGVKAKLPEYPGQVVVGST